MDRSKRREPITGISTAGAEKDGKATSTENSERAVNQTLQELVGGDQ